MAKEKVLTLYGALSPIISVDDVPASVKEVHLLGQPSMEAVVLLEELGASRHLEKIVFFACDFRRWDYVYRSFEKPKEMLKLRAESLEFWRCKNPSWGLMYLAQPTVRNVLLWCCDQFVLPEKEYSIYDKHLSRDSCHHEFWAGLKRLDVTDLWEHDPISGLDFSEVLNICTSLKVLNIIHAHRT